MTGKKTATQSQKLMVFVLTMSLYGLATLFTELIPKFQVGIVEFSVEYFLFIPLTLAKLFDPIGARLLFIYQCNLYPFPHRLCDLYHKIQRRIVAAALEAGDIRLGNPRLSAKLRLCHAV